MAGLVFYDITFPATATVNGETITGSGGGSSISLTFSMTRTSPTLTPSVLEFAAEPDRIDRGGSTSLRWTVFNAVTVSIDHGIGAKAPVGIEPLSPDSTTTYMLTAISSTGTTAAAQTTVTVTGAMGKRRAVRH